MEAINTRHMLISARERESANDATIGLLHASLDEEGAKFPLQRDTIDANTLCANKVLSGERNSLLSSLSIEHSLILSYTFSCRHDNRMIHVSPTIANLGFDQELWLDKADFRLQQVHEEDLERVALALQHSLSTGEKFNCLYRLYDSCGKVRWFHDEATVAFDDMGMPMFLEGIMLDITDKKELETELDEHRYYIERKVEQRTEQLMKQMALLESCNATLCKKLELTRIVPVTVKQHAVTAWWTDLAAQTMQENDCAESLDGLSDYVRSMFGCRVAAAGAIA